MAGGMAERGLSRTLTKDAVTSPTRRRSHAMREPAVQRVHHIKIER